MTQDQVTRRFEKMSEEQFNQMMSYLDADLAAKAALKGKTHEEMVKNYLDELRKTNERLAQNYPANPQGKTIKDCMEYITNFARKNSNSRSEAMVASFVVFDWAVEYFINPDIKKIEKPKPVAAPTKKPEDKLSELLKQKHDWEEANKKKIDEWEIENNAKIDAFNKKHEMDLFPPENPHANAVNPYLDKVFPAQEELDKILNEATQKNNPNLTPAEQTEDADDSCDEDCETTKDDEETDNEEE